MELIAGLIALLVVLLPIAVIAILAASRYRTLPPREVEPGWYPDPRGSHEQRYWDGDEWTDEVSDDGVTSEDPLDHEHP